jgi:nucleotide-binding universal stress UspA family protein
MNILVGYDGSSPSKKALQLAKKHALAFGATVDVVTSMDKGNTVEAENKASDNLEKAKSLFAEKGINCQTHLLIRGMFPGEDIVEFADSNKVDEIFIGVKRRSRVGKLLMGSTAQFVILEAHCPVVSVK